MRLINADDFIKEINNRCEAAIKWGINAIADHNEEIKIRAEQAVATFCEASLTAKKMPTIDAEPRETGYWLPYEFGDYHWHKCSVCGKADKYIETIRNGGDLQAIRHFCPICGARMDEDEISNIAKESADKISKALEKVRAKGMQKQNIKEDDKT